MDEKELEQYKRSDQVGQMLYHRVWESRGDARDPAAWKALGITQQGAQKRLAYYEKELAAHQRSAVRERMESIRERLARPPSSTHEHSR